MPAGVTAAEVCRCLATALPAPVVARAKAGGHFLYVPQSQRIILLLFRVCARLLVLARCCAFAHRLRGREVQKGQMRPFLEQFQLLFQMLIGIARNGIIDKSILEGGVEAPIF
jgi:hypothetical protein